METPGLRTGLWAGYDWPKLAYRAHYSVRAIARLCATNAHGLRRLCRQYQNCTPKQWLMRLRTRRAEDLVMLGRSAAQIARELFYTDAAHFCRDFKKHHGLCPFHWREKERQRQRLAERERAFARGTMRVAPSAPW